MNKFYKTTYTFEVLSEQPLDSLSFTDVVQSTIFGDCSGEVKKQVVKVLSKKQMAEALKAQGSDPSFFGLDDEGK